MKLWQKIYRLTIKLPILQWVKTDFFDLHLAAYDCQASIAHTQMLGKIGILAEQEVKQ